MWADHSGRIQLGTTLDIRSVSCVNPAGVLAHWLLHPFGSRHMGKRSQQAVSDVLRRWLGNERDSPAAPADRLFERFMRHLPGLAWLKDVSGKFVYVNDATSRAFGCPADELIGKSNADIMPAAQAEQCDASDRDAAESEAGLQVIESFRHADGSIHSALVSKFAISGTHDEPMLVGGVAIDITDRIEVEQRLKRSEERLRLATHSGKMGLWDWDIAKNRISWTDSLYRIHGVDPDKFPRTVEAFAELVHSDDREHVVTAITAALESKRDYDIEFRVLKPDGSIVWLYTNAEVLFEQGHPVRMVGATFDITKRKQTEIALKESEERFAKAFNASPLALTLSSLVTGKLLAVNDTFCRVTGYSREEALGKTTAELGLWTNNADREAEIATVRTRGGVRDREYRFRSRTGKETIGLLSAERIDIRGEPHALSVIQDITERANATLALRLSEERMRLALRGANAGAWVFNTNAEQTYWSTELRNLFGFGPDVPRTLANLRERVHPEDRERWHSEFKSLLRAGEGEFRQEFRIVHPERGIRWMLTLGRIDRSDGVVNCHGISLDISRLKEVEDELRREDQRKNEFLATLAHELRNPLAPIRNGLEILRLTAGNGEIARDAREMMERQLRQMVRLIDDLLDLSRISRGKIALKRGRVDLMSIVHNALEVSRPLIEKANHQLTLEIASEALFVNADGTRLAQVFANLLNNASKYTNDGGHIRVHVTREDDYALVSVQDNGVGIPKEVLGKVFDMFMQVDRSLEKAQGGLGIGLSIARQLVDMHEGTIEARSDGLGKGSEFRVRLPLAAGRGASTSESDPGMTTYPTGLRILVADDNIDAASTLAMMLKLNGNDVRTARDGVEAVEIARSYEPNVVLLDIGMPRLNGYDACRYLRAMPALANCLIVATTGWGQDDDVQRSREAGFDHHLVKPVAARTLEELLTRTFPAARRGR